MQRIKKAMLLTLILLLVACSKGNIHEQIHEQLQSVIEIEADFESVQKEILDLEEKDLEIYNEIIQLDGTEIDQLRSLTKEAIDLLEKRLHYIELEKSTMNASKEAFHSVSPLIEQIQSEEENVQLNEMVESMMRRYEAYDEVYDAYVQSIHLTSQLYELLQQQVDESSLYHIIQSVNKSYEKVFHANHQFNQETKSYNYLKQTYYKTVWGK